jgi:hypothetical protein
MMVALMVLCLLVSVLFLGGGILSLSQATLGVGSIAIACLFAIFARIAQAASHVDRLAAAISRPSTPAPQPAAISEAPRAHVHREPNQNEIRCHKCGHVAPRGPATCPLCQARY